MVPSGSKLWSSKGSGLGLGFFAFAGSKRRFVTKGLWLYAQLRVHVKPAGSLSRPPGSKSSLTNPTFQCAPLSSPNVQIRLANNPKPETPNPKPLTLNPISPKLLCMNGCGSDGTAACKADARPRTYIWHSHQGPGPTKLHLLPTSRNFHSESSQNQNP